MAEMGKVLQIKDLDKSFGGVHAINHLSFDVYEGEILGLIGPNGSGKSTCVNLITGVYIQDQGDIIFKNDIYLKKQSIEDRARMGLGRTFQTPRPFLDLTVWESIYTIALLYNKTMKEASARADEIIDMIGFHDIANLVCHKLPIEKRKWLDMARALAINPKIMMLDECLAGLNPIEMESSIEFVKKLNSQGITIIFIEHVMSAVSKLCTRVVVLSEGSLLSQGDPKQVMKEEKVIKAYLGEDYVNEYVGD